MFFHDDAARGLPVHTLFCQMRTYPSNNGPLSRTISGFHVGKFCRPILYIVPNLPPSLETDTGLYRIHFSRNSRLMLCFTRLGIGFGNRAAS